MSADHPEWQRLTVGSLRAMLDDMVKDGDITDDTLIVVDSDPEGNSLHPLRTAAGLGSLEFGPAGRIEDFIDSDIRPAATLWIGVGY